MTEAPPLLFRWTGENYEPASKRWAKLCDKHLTIGEETLLVAYHERSDATHRHFFSIVHEAWLNLSHEQSERWVTSEHLRKWCLIKTGYADSRSVVCSSKAEAVRFAAFLQPVDAFAVVTVEGNVVTHFTARSQSYRSMDKKTFAESKQKILDLLSDLLGTSTKQLSEAGREA